MWRHRAAAHDELHQPTRNPETTMKKLLTTLALALGLLFGGLALAPTSYADDSQNPGCSDTDPQLPPCTPDPGCSDTDSQLPPCSTPPCAEDSQTSCPDTQRAPVVASSSTCAADQTVNDYRAQVAALTAKADRLQRVVNRRAATIQRLRAKIRALR